MIPSLHIQTLPVISFFLVSQKAYLFTYINHLYYIHSSIWKTLHSYTHLIYVVQYKTKQGGTRQSTQKRNQGGQRAYMICNDIVGLQGGQHAGFFFPQCQVFIFSVQYTTFPQV